MQSNTKKRQRSMSHRHSATGAITDSTSDKTVAETAQILHRTNYAAVTFNDPTTADILLHLYVEPMAPITDDTVTVTDNIDNNIKKKEEFESIDDDVEIYLHSHIVTRAKYFSAILSERWQMNTKSRNLTPLKLSVAPTENSVTNHLTVLQLLYTNDFTTVITSPTAALNILPVALQLLFEDCVKNCVKFLEAVPWTEEEERRVINLIPLLNEEESESLLSRVRVYNSKCNSSSTCEEMLYGLILSAIHNNPNTAFAKAFVAKLLRDFAKHSSRDSVRAVLERAFEESFKVVKESLEEYSSPDFRGRGGNGNGGGGGDYNETEAMQRLNLHTALTNGKHLLWVVERMIELKVADNAVREWSEGSGGFTSDLQRAFRDDAWRNIVPGLPTVVLRCTSKFANAVANGTILAARQVRMKLVKDWLPILIACKDNASPMGSSHKSLYLELEETFLRIISTLPLSDAQELLKQCLSFSTRNVEDCPHLVDAFNTWFRRAMQPPPPPGNIF